MIGGNRCPIVDTWWQTETGAIMISPIPGAVATKPGSATLPLPGIDAEVVTIARASPFRRARADSWSSSAHGHRMVRTIYGDPERYEKQYWSQIPGMYFTGDGARSDADGYFWLMGRVDDVINVTGHRLSTMEVESRAGGASEGGRSRGGRASRRAEGPGDRRFRHARRAATSPAKS